MKSLPAEDRLYSGADRTAPNPRSGGIAYHRVGRRHDRMTCLCHRPAKSLERAPGGTAQEGKLQRQGPDASALSTRSVWATRRISGRFRGTDGNCRGHARPVHPCRGRPVGVPRRRPDAKALHTRRGSAGSCPARAHPGHPCSRRQAEAPDNSLRLDRTAPTLRRVPSEGGLLWRLLEDRNASKYLQAPMKTMDRMAADGTQYKNDGLSRASIIVKLTAQAAGPKGEADGLPSDWKM